jgi:hypothetical protein
MMAASRQTKLAPEDPQPTTFPSTKVTQTTDFAKNLPSQPLAFTTIVVKARVTKMT